MGNSAQRNNDSTDCQLLEEKSQSPSWPLRDLASIWHPFTQARTAPPPIPIVRGDGAYLYTESGEAYLDANSSWWVNLHGHSHPYIIRAIEAQMQKLQHTLFAGFTHPPAIALAERLLSLLPGKFDRIFYTDNGSTAVEAALKMVFQASKGKKGLLSFQGAYHGDTFGAMAASGRTHYNRPFWPYLFPVNTIPPPLFGREEESWEAFEMALATTDLAAFIFEPLVQASGGMRLYCSKTLAKMIKACQERGIIAIADEVMTGFGRTGSLFASPAPPDIICLAKSITGGYLPLGATAVKNSLFEKFFSPEIGAFLHGHSYTANPLACAAANANLDLLLEPACAASRARIESEHRQFQKKWKNHPKLLRCECLGTLLVLEYKTETGSYFDPLKEQLTLHFQNRGILMRPLGNVLYVLPPYCIANSELQKIYATIIETLES
ncbi:MAG: adenosylmethionine--8-amino-7-oxononanoate transaminase [Verrucomicrobia bacterium]|nr:adenosylmethionine--8-amino-7-oxononanoate transaminase [Verrucomicrobiota bacterium]